MVSYLGQENVGHGLRRVVLGVLLAGSLPLGSHLGNVHSGAVQTVHALGRRGKSPFHHLDHHLDLSGLTDP